MTTVNGNTSTTPIVFTVPQQNTPTITSISPVSGFQNSTVYFTLAGTNFQIGTFGSNVTFFNQTYFDTYGINMTANLTSVSPTSITGKVFVLPDATTGTNGWMVNVTTVDGGTSTSPIRFTVVKPIPTITLMTPASGMRTSLVTFSMTGTNFQPGTGNTTVTLFNQTYFTDHTANVTAQLTSVTSTAITGNFTVPADAAFGKWFVNVTTINGGTSTTPIVFTVPQQNTPTITSISPATGFQNSTVAFTLAGTNFQIGTGGSIVTFFNQSDFDAYGINMTANLTSVTPTSITGRVFILSNATIGTNGWIVNVTTVDGGTSTSPIRFTVVKPVPTITLMTPVSGVRTSLVTFSMTGTNFQPGTGNTTVTLFNQTYGTLTATLTSVAPTAITGNFTVPADAAFGKWFVNVTTVNGNTSTTPITFTVPQQNTPTITSISPVSGFQNSTVAFTLAGTNFQIGTFGSNVTFFNQSVLRYLRHQHDR